jgi:hypothetical protein
VDKESVFPFFISMNNPEEVELESEEFRMPKMKRCDLCVHSPVCMAYDAIQNIEVNFKEKYQFIKDFPTKPVALATMCKEYEEKAETDVINTYKSDSCGC